MSVGANGLFPASGSTFPPDVGDLVETLTKSVVEPLNTMASVRPSDVIKTKAEQAQKVVSQISQVIGGTLKETDETPLKP